MAVGSADPDTLTDIATVARGLADTVGPLRVLACAAPAAAPSSTSASARLSAAGRATPLRAWARVVGIQRF